MGMLTVQFCIEELARFYLSASVATIDGGKQRNSSKLMEPKLAVLQFLVGV